MHQEKRKVRPVANNHVLGSGGDASTKGKSRAVRGAAVGFQEGAIVRIKLQNILTYESVEFRTGPSLNVIIGPNGTGKSAIVCAICLGLAGKTSWLGRASSPADYIRYGTNHGVIELELYNCDGDNYVIRREITKGKDTKVTTSWLVNGRPATLKSVEEMVARLNIQVGNLVQFLPQEKVADFARMTQEQLLINTEKAVGTADMYKAHEQLIELGLRTHDIDKRLEVMRSDLETEVQKNDRLKSEVENYREREKYLEKVNILKMKRPWLEYQQLKAAFDKTKQQRDQEAEALKRAEKEHVPIQQQVDQLSRLKEAVDAELKQLTVEIRESATKVSENSRNLEELDEKIQETKSDFEQKREEEEKRQRKMEDLKSQLRALEAELSQLEGADETHLDREIQEVAEKMRKLLREINTITQEGCGISSEVNNLRREIREAQHDLRNIQDVGNQRLEQLRRFHRPTYDAVIWLRENKQKFKATIHEPIILCLHMIDARHAKYIETHISAGDMRAFVCEDPDDLELFMAIMRDEQQLRVNAVKAPTQPVSSFQPKVPIDRIRQYGFYSYMKDLFNCPAPVMAYLCLQYNVFRIPVGDEGTRKNLEAIKTKLDFRMFYTAHEQYSIKTSRYDGSVSSRNSPLKDSKFLAASIDTQKEQVLLQTIQNVQRTLEEKENKYRELQRNQADREKDLNICRERKKELSSQKDQKRRVQQQIETKKESIRRVAASTIDLDETNRQEKDKICSIVSKKTKLLAQMHKYTEKCFELSKRKVYQSLKQAETVRRSSMLEARHRDKQQELQTLHRQVDALKQRVKDAKQLAREKLSEAKRATNTERGEELSAELRQAFDACPKTLEELDDDIHRHQARADSIFQIDEAVIQQYQNREKEIARMRTDLQRREQEEQTLKGDLTDKRNEWLTPLKELIGRINTNFAHFFEAMDCCGEVDLNIPADQEDYEKYGIRIKVKFRDGEALRELTPFHQSGGERSVATVLYMMSLQELARCPFRCVDEINQGMDPVNERKVFELVVQTVCKQSSSQYFLLTPKLLPDLEYADNMTVLCVNNGPHIMSHRQWNLRDFIRRGAAVNQCDDSS